MMGAFILGYELGDVETLGVAKGEDNGDAVIDGGSEGSETSHWETEGSIDACSGRHRKAKSAEG